MRLAFDRVLSVFGDVYIFLVEINLGGKREKKKKIFIYMKKVWSSANKK